MTRTEGPRIKIRGFFVGAQKVLMMTEKVNPDRVRITKLDGNDPLPFDLLLLADEERQAIEKYIHQSEIYVAAVAGEKIPVGVIAVLPVNDQHLEIKALAVDPRYQNTGIGKLLIDQARAAAAERGFAELHVGTADGATREIAYYESRGFRRFALKEDFFVTNYSKPLFDHGVRLRDMVMLKMELPLPGNH